MKSLDPFPNTNYGRLTALAVQIFFLDNLKITRNEWQYRVHKLFAITYQLCRTVYVKLT